MKTLRKSISFIICLTVILAIPCAAFAAEYSRLETMALNVRVDGGDVQTVRAYESVYEGNIYVSMNDLSVILNGTDRQFSFSCNYNNTDGTFFTVNRGEESRCYLRSIGYGTLVVEFRRNTLLLDGNSVRYYTYAYDGDLFMSLTDVQLLLDLNCSYENRDSVNISTKASFAPDIDALREMGYFDYINGIVLGDADTGEIIFFQYRNRTTSIASTTKLMTWLVMAEAIGYGDISYNDTVTISENAAKLSASADGVIKMTAGQKVPLTELIDAMMLASSNEAALAIAEHISGSEELFVRRMQGKAEELELGTAKFYNCNGLPYYAKSTIAAKLQNRMSAADMFTLSAYILRTHPEITDVTSKQFSHMPSLEYTTANSNPLVFNIPGCNGLKTGLTNRAGSCLVSSVPMTVGRETHNIVMVLLGAENGSERGQEAQILYRYAEEYFSANGFRSAA